MGLIRNSASAFGVPPNVVNPNSVPSERNAIPTRLSMPVERGFAAAPVDVLTSYNVPSALFPSRSSALARVPRRKSVRQCRREHHRCDERSSSQTPTCRSFRPQQMSPIRGFSAIICADVGFDVHR